MKELNHKRSRISRRHRLHTRRTRVPHHLLVFAGVCGGILLLICGYNVISFSPSVTTPSVEAASPQQVLPAKNVQLAWPTAGEAAVGSVEGGLLARSSDNEALRPTASMAKVITALAVMKKQPLELGQYGPSYTLTADDVATYQAYAMRGGSVLPVYDGMELTEYQALQAMLIPSANNIAETLVERVFGSQQAYVAYAQNMLHQMGLNRTVVADASGFNPATESTPSELVAIGIAALQNPVIAEIVAQPQAQIPGVGTVDNTNELLGENGVVGIKTGTTDSAGNCLLFAAKYTDKNGKDAIIVGDIMGDTDETALFKDSGTLLASARQNFGLTDPQTTNGGTMTPFRQGNRISR